MAATGTPTTNLGLRIMNGTDPVDVADINANSQTLDSKIGAIPSGKSAQSQITEHTQAITKVQNGLAYIVGNTNTTGGTIAVGQFVYVKNHSTIAEGLRMVTASISANGNITTSNTSACPEGGLNALNSKIADFRAYTANWRSYTTLASALAANQSVYSDYSIVLVNATLSGGAMYFGYIFKKDSSNMFAQFWSTTGIATNLQTTDGGNTWA